MESAADHERARAHHRRIPAPPEYRVRSAEPRCRPLAALRRAAQRSGEDANDRRVARDGARDTGGVAAACNRARFTGGLPTWLVNGGKALHRANLDAASIRGGPSGADARYTPPFMIPDGSRTRHIIGPEAGADEGIGGSVRRAMAFVLDLLIAPYALGLALIFVTGGVDLGVV